MRFRLVALFYTSLASMSVSAQLSPPVGPVTDSFKNLDEVEPRIPINQDNTPGSLGFEYVISSPGSYYFTGDVATTNKTILLVDATGDVTIDLNGFSLDLNGVTEDVIVIGSMVDTCTIRDGHLEGGQDVVA